jgi:hypothetical protein
MGTRRNVLALVLVLLLAGIVWPKLVRGTQPISFTDFVTAIPAVISAAISLDGIFREKDKRQHDKARPFRLTPSFRSGLYGGLIGGALAGCIIGTFYYIGARPSGDVGWQRIPATFSYATLMGALLGFSTQRAIMWFHPSDVIGGILGGAVAGIIGGVLGGLLFFPLSGPDVDPGLLMVGSSLGAICVGLGALFYDYEGRWRNLWRALLISAIILGFAVVTGIALSQQQQIASALELHGPIEGGAILGLVVGTLVGLQVGITLWLFPLWENAAETTAR